jgi:hypothetical protein
MNLIGNTTGILVTLLAAVAGGSATERIIDQGTSVPIGVAVSVGMTAIGLAIVIARMLQKLQDSVDLIKDRNEEYDSRFNSLEETISALECQRPLKCENHKDNESH